MIFDYYKGVFGLLLAVIATFFWRFLGIMLAERIPTNGFWVRWVNSVAYAMVAGIMMMILVFPVGTLASTTLTLRLISLSVGLIFIYFSKNLFLGIVTAIVTFAIVGFLKL